MSKQDTDREEIADILRQGYHGIAETRVINALAALVARREATLAQKILDQGHNLDCMFCGFKDKVAEDVLTTEATQSGKEAEG